MLVVEDEERFAAGLRDGLEAEGFAVDIAPDGVDGLWLARENTYDGGARFLVTLPSGERS